MRILSRASLKMLAAVAATALLAGGATATAQSLITSADIRDNTIRSTDVRNRTLGLRTSAARPYGRCEGGEDRQGREGREGSKGREARRGSSARPARAGPRTFST